MRTHFRVISPLLFVVIIFFNYVNGQIFTAHVNFGKYLSQGLAWGDYDNDGYQDVYITNGGQTQTAALRWENFLYHNNGDGTFDSVATGALVTDVSTSGGCSWGDYDNDGDLDLIVAEPTHRDEVIGTTTIYYSKNSFYRNDGNGTFSSITLSPITDETQSGGFGTGTSRISPAWCDLNNDGWLDIFESNSMFNSTKDTHSVWISTQDGGFSSQSSNLTSDQTARGGLSMVDFDNDGDLDIATASGAPAGETNIWVNTPSGWTKYTLIPSGQPNGRTASGVSWGDYDNDGDFDIFVSIKRDYDDSKWAPNKLFRNDTSSPDTPVFTEMTTSDVGTWLADSSFSYGSCWGDYDNDGYLDLFVGNDGPPDQGYRNFLLHNNGNGTFTKIQDGEINDSTYIKACAWADYDNDGDLDLIGGRDGKNILFENTSSGNHWLNIRLVDTRTNTNTSAIGSRVEVYAPTKQIREVITQTGMGSQSSLRQHFGLGSATSVDSVVVKWMSIDGSNNRVHTAYSHLPADKLIIYTYGDLDVTASVLAGRTFMYLFGNTGAAIEFTANSDADGGSVNVIRHNTGPGNNSFSGSATAPDGSTVTPNVAASDRYWVITETGMTGNFTSTVYLDISGMSGVSNRDKLVLLSRPNSSSAWQPHNTYRIGNTLYTTGVTSFSEWTVGANSSDNSLPVELLSFKAEPGDGFVVLRWQTASEVENLGFVLERKTQRSDFREIASFKQDENLKGQGNSSTMSEYSFRDDNLVNGQEYVYRLSDVSYSGKKTILKTLQVVPSIQITDFRLMANYPNPFGEKRAANGLPQTVIRYQVPQKSAVTIRVYNQLGQLVKELVHSVKDKGDYLVTFNAADLPSGLYFYTMRSGSFYQVRKMVLVR